ncbi:MAG: McrC family protein [Actinomycetota bacterium]|nr:McrC family protein [Actinomycetota bacterium]
MTRIEVPELGVLRCALTPEQGRRLAGSGVLDATPSPEDPGLWDLRARGRVGVARVGDVEVWIPPKLPIDRLLFLAGYARKPDGWREEIVGLEPHRELVPAVAQALWRLVERALRPGLLQGYHTVEESAMVLRGRLREADQLRRHHGRPLPMEIRHDDFSVDIAENQILLAAITRLLTVPRIDAESRLRLSALRARLAAVTTLVRGTELPRWHPTRLNLRYQAALRLAEIVWRACSPEHTAGAVATSGFLFNLPLLFEDFVATALAEALAARAPGLASPQHRCHLDEAGAVRMKPDLVWEQGGRPVAVVDAKYKRETPAGYPDADLYQMLAYCTALALPRGHLVYAQGGVEPARHVVRHTRIEIVCHALNLALPPAALLAAVARLAEELVAVDTAAA